MGNFVAAKEAADAIEHLAKCDTTDRVYDLLDETEERVYSTAAPDLRAVAEKLEIYWGEELFSEEDYVAPYKQRIIGDIRRTHLLNADVDNEDASGGMDLQRIAKEWATALAEYNHYVELLEARQSDRQQHSKTSDLVALRVETENKLLSLHAPNLSAVIRKLELLWSGDDRYDPASEAADQHRILRDLHCLEWLVAS
jgi:hypothetical protein